MDCTHVMYICSDCKNRTIIAPKTNSNLNNRLAEVSVFDVSWICPDCAIARVEQQIMEQQMQANAPIEPMENNFVEDENHNTVEDSADEIIPEII